MQKSDETHIAHYFITLLLGVVGLLIILVSVSIRSQAETVNTSATIDNQVPSVDSVTVATSSNGANLDGSILTPAENSTRTIHVYGTYTDNNGCDEVSDGGSLFAQLSRNGIATTTCQTGSANNPLNCYVAEENASSSLHGPGLNCVISNCSGGTDVQANYACTIPVHHFVDATDSSTYSAEMWRSYVSVADQSAAPQTKNGIAFEVATNNAIDAGANIAYGSLALGATSASDQTLAVTNTGNKNGSDILISGSSMSCTEGTITAGKHAYATTTGVAYGSKRTLSGDATAAGMSIKKQIASTTAATSNTYWMIQLPSSGLSGTCSGSITVTAN